MTPFGERLRQMRRQRGVTQKEMAQALGVTPSYLSALEHGRRGVPTWPMVQKIIGYFNVIWDEAGQLQLLAAMSDPRVVVDTAGLPAQATALANRLAACISDLDEDDAAAVLATLDERLAARNRVSRAPSVRRTSR